MSDQVLKITDKQSVQPHSGNTKPTNGKGYGDKAQAKGWTLVKAKSATKMAKNWGTKEGNVDTNNGSSSLTRCVNDPPSQIMVVQQGKYCERGQSSKGDVDDQHHFPLLLR